VVILEFWSDFSRIVAHDTFEQALNSVQQQLTTTSFNQPYCLMVSDTDPRYLAKYVLSDGTIIFISSLIVGIPISWSV